jgi:hypothetical protein
MTHDDPNYCATFLLSEGPKTQDFFVLSEAAITDSVGTLLAFRVKEGSCI